MQYRPEIDGLRTVAVVPVILYHAQFPLFSGGFVGVDVFFVISGFLITSILLGDLEKSRFSILRFYEKRARRILPALFFVILASLPFAWFMMLPDPFENFAQSVVATIFFSNNILLNMTSGYWDLSAEFKPLLHTWSLGVEEQFYIVIPVIIFLTWRYARQLMLPIFVALAVTSFAWCQATMARSPDAAFYMVHTRAWELLLGSIAALLSHRAVPVNRDLPAALGLGCILVATFTFDQDTPFPSYTALLPAAGTALILYYARSGGLVARLLSAGPMVGIGLISYSLYLWHQPIFAFARIGSVDPLSHLLYLPLILLTGALSYLSWRYVESPFRDPVRVPVRGLTLFSLGGAGTLIAAAMVVYLGYGMPGRFFDMDRDEIAGAYISYNMRVHRYSKDGFPDSARPDLVVIGNSQARDFVNMMIEAGEAERFDLVYWPGYHPCDPDKQSPQAAEAIARADAVIFASFDMTENCWSQIEKGLVAEKNGAVLFVGPKHFGYNLNPFARVPREERPSARIRVPDHVVARNQKFARIIPNTHFLDILGIMSEQGNHLPVFDADGLLVSADGGHVTRQGAALIGNRILKGGVWADFVSQAEAAAADKP